MNEEPGKHLIEPGPILSGTTLTSDKLIAFWAEFERHYPEGTVLGKKGEWEGVFTSWEDMSPVEFKARIDGSYPSDDPRGWLAEDAEYLVDSLVDDLDTICYNQRLTFGANPDDPACWGYWPHEEENDA
jgi:hypothetical protein